MSKPVRILTTGGRNFNDRDFIFRTMDSCVPYFADYFCVANGWAHGADKGVQDWLRERGYPGCFFPPLWEYYGLSAGHRRNAWMFDFFLPEVVIAFPGGPGTAGTVEIANSRGIPVYNVTV